MIPWGMAEQKPRRPTGRTYNVDYAISVGRDRNTNGVVIRLKDEEGRTIALRLYRQQARNLANGLTGFVESLD